MQIEALKYGLEFEYSDIFTNPTIRELLSKNKKSDIYNISDLDYDLIDSVLKRNSMDNISSIKKCPVNNIMIIGTTGYLGIHLIKKFLDTESGTVYCLIRPKFNIDPLQGLVQTFNFYFGNDSYIKYKY